MCIFKNRIFNKQRDKVFLCVVAIFLSLYSAFSLTCFSSSAQGIKDEVVRLHILANSDSDEDQQIKLRVRDALLEENTMLLSSGVNTENAQIYFKESKDTILKSIERTLKENGFSYDAQVSLEKEYFETREYGNLTFPAGEYLALKVILGEGTGKNWWCVMFPPLCVPAADNVTVEGNISEYITPLGEKLLYGGEKYVMKFKILELYEAFMEKIKQ